MTMEVSISVSDLINKLVETNDMADVSFFQMPDSVCLHNDRPFTAKTQRMKTKLSSEAFIALGVMYAGDTASEMKTIFTHRAG